MPHKNVIFCYVAAVSGRLPQPDAPVSAGAGPLAEDDRKGGLRGGLLYTSVAADDISQV